MSKLMKYIIAAVLIVAMTIPTGMSIVKANKIPTFDIVSVVPDEIVTIQTYDFPADKNFDVLIGRYGTYGISGIQVATQSSDNGGTFTATFKIPAELKGITMLSIRMEDKESGYYAYNWFENAEVPADTTISTVNTEATSVPVEEAKHPSFIISDVETGKNITVQGNDFPVKEDFDVLMGVYGNFGIGGEKVTVQKTGDKGEFKAVYAIPADLTGVYMIAVRMESTTSDYFAFNYFYNTSYLPTEVMTTQANATEATAEAASSQVSPTVESAYQGYPYLSITQVKKDGSVTIEAENLPANEVFDVYMSNFLVNNDAVKSGTLNSGKGGKATGTYVIPPELKGAAQISIRLSGQKTGYFAYNYFFNVDFPVVITPAPTEVNSTAEPTKEAAAQATPQPTLPATPTAVVDNTETTEATTPAAVPSITPTAH